jgi:RimJ/RimL family protein N-acetyltransferase
MPWAADEPQTVEQKVSLLRHFRGRFDEGEDFVYGILDPSEERVLGGSGLHPRSGKDMREIGYWVRADAQGKGIIGEATAALTRVAFELEGVDRVEATLRRRLTYPNGRRDVMIWTMFADDYPGSPCAEAALEAFDVQGERLL